MRNGLTYNYIEQKVKYTFELQSGKRVLSGDWRICTEVNHATTKVGDEVLVVIEENCNSLPTQAKIVGKRTFDWDWSKPLGANNRMSNAVVVGEMVK